MVQWFKLNGKIAQLDEKWAHLLIYLFGTFTQSLYAAVMASCL